MYPDNIVNNKNPTGSISTLLFWIFVLVLNLPNFLWLEPSSSLLVNITELIETLLLGTLLGAIFLACFSRPQQAWRLLWLLFLWWQPLAIGVRSINNTSINPTLVGMGMATSPAELSNLVAVIPWLWLLFFVLWNVSCCGVLRWLNQHNQWRWNKVFRGKVVFFNVAILTLPYVISPSQNLIPEPKPASPYQDKSIHASQEAELAIGGGGHLPNTFPYELPLAIAQYWRERRAVDAIRAHLSFPSSDHTLTNQTPQADIVVLVIGESSTRNAWHWFNSQAPTTTPRLETRLARGEQLFGFTRTLALTTSTRQAVPSMLTAQPLVWPDGTPNPQATLSIVSVAAQAGYATAWLSNQAAVGKYDGVIASYAQEASTITFLNPSSFSDKGSFDEVLLPVLNKFLFKNHRAFVVLHTMGSHFNYQYRYPHGFGPYPNSDEPRQTYFNSIAYTDKVLDQIIDMLANDGRRAVLVYASDHGETIPDGDCHSPSANRQTRDAYEIPAVVWLSHSYANKNPNIAQRLANNQNSPYTITAIHQTLLDLMRGEAQQPPTNTTTSSFVRSATHTTADEDDAVMWTREFEQALTKNQCFMLLSTRKLKKN